MKRPSVPAWLAILSLRRSRSIFLLAAWALLPAVCGLAAGPGGAVPAGPAPHKLPIAAVIDFESSTLTGPQQDAFSQAIWAEFYKEPNLALLPRAESRRFLISVDLLPDPPYGPAVPLNKVAAVLKADYVLAGHVNQVGGTCTLDYAIYSVKLGKVVSKESYYKTGKFEDLVLYVPSLASSMLDLIRNVESGAIVNAPPALEHANTAPAASASVSDTPAEAKAAPADKVKRADEAKKSREETHARDAAQEKTVAKPAAKKDEPKAAAATKKAAAAGEKQIAKADSKAVVAAAPAEKKAEKATAAKSEDLPAPANAASSATATPTPAPEIKAEKTPAPPPAATATPEPPHTPAPTAATPAATPSATPLADPPKPQATPAPATMKAEAATQTGDSVEKVQIPPPVTLEGAPAAAATPAPTPKPAAEVKATPKPAPKEIKKPETKAAQKSEAKPEAKTEAKQEPKSTPAPAPAPQETPAPAASASAPAPAPVAKEQSPAPSAAVSDANREAAKEAYKKATVNPVGSSKRIEELKKAVALDPTVGDYKKSLAMSYYFAKDYPKSIETCHSAISLMPKDSLLYTLLGSAHFESQQWAEAREAQEHALKIDPENLYSRFNLALTLQAQGSPDAVGAWEDYIKRSEGNEDQKSNRERAQEYLKELKAKKP